MHRDALLGEERRQQAVGRAVAVGRGDDVPAGPYACSQQRRMDRRHARRHGKRRLAVFKRCHGAFERIDRRAFVAAIDITVFLAGKDRFHGRGRRLEIAHGVVDRRGDGCFLGCGLALARVDSLGKNTGHNCLFQVAEGIL